MNNVSSVNKLPQIDIATIIAADDLKDVAAKFGKQDAQADEPCMPGLYYRPDDPAYHIYVEAYDLAIMDATLAALRKPGYTVSPSSDLEWQHGWSVFHQALPVGIYIRTNIALDGWKAARQDALAVDVD